MNRCLKLFFLLLAASLLIVSCQKEVIPDNNGKTDPVDNKEDVEEDDDVYKGLIPQVCDELPKLYIDTPLGVGVSSDKTVWTKLCRIKILVKVDGVERTVYESDSLRIRGRGNSTWAYYPKKPYRFNLKKKANFIGSGQTKKWVLLANWMDRTLLRNDVALEAARRTSLEWIPSGTFVEFYLDGQHMGNYWLGEKVNVEKGNFLADYLYSFDTSGNIDDADFTTSQGYWNKERKKTGGIPTYIKYPDLDDAEDVDAAVLSAKNALYAAESAIYSSNWKSVLDVDSFVDALLVNELVQNQEIRHPKSFYVYLRDGKLYAGPVWDFDWGTFTRSDYYAKSHKNLNDVNAIYYNRLMSLPEFKNRFKERWKTLKPQFVALLDYIDEKAAWIKSSEAVNHSMWPCFPNPFAGSEGTDGYINFDELMTFDEAVQEMKTALNERIEIMDSLINKL